MFKRSLIETFVGVLAVVFCGCFFDADLTLHNDPPVCTNRSSIVVSLVYPESSVCTLTVDDRNDSVLAVRVVPAAAGIADTRWRDSALWQAWPGAAKFAGTGFGVKNLALSLDTNRMGRYSGMLILQDAASATCALPYTINKLFFDPFDTYPPDNAWWRMYVDDDSLHVRPERIDGKLVFSFVKSADSLTALVATGIRTVFSMQADFYSTIDFKLRDEMDDAFEVGFFISTSSDTGRWDGERAGIFITGVGGRLRFECRSVNMQSYSLERSETAGELGIRRVDSTLTYYFHDGDPAVTPQPLTSQIFPMDVPVYVHLKMSVRNLAKTRNCYWNDFRVLEGLLRFPAK